MIAPLDQAAMRARHSRQWFIGALGRRVEFCDECSSSQDPPPLILWPCGPIQALDALAEAHRTIEGLKTIVEDREDKLGELRAVQPERPYIPDWGDCGAGFQYATEEARLQAANAELEAKLAEVDQRLADVNVKDSIKTREINLLTDEVRRVGAKLAEAERERDRLRRFHQADCNALLDDDSDSVLTDCQACTCGIVAPLLGLLGLCVYCGLQEKFQTPEAMVDGVRAHVQACSARPERALEADLAAKTAALERIEHLTLLADPSIWQSTIAEIREETAAALSSSPGAAWQATAREVVEVLETTAECLAALESPPGTHGYAVVQQARALLARPEVQRLGKP